MAVEPVSARARSGGHHVNAETIQRLYIRGHQTFFKLYLPLVDSWQLRDSSGIGVPKIIARGRKNTIVKMENPVLWHALKGQYHD